jgi:hypothetical protein
MTRLDDTGLPHQIAAALGTPSTLEGDGAETYLRTASNHLLVALTGRYLNHGAVKRIEALHAALAG